MAKEKNRQNRVLARGIMAYGRNLGYKVKHIAKVAKAEPKPVEEKKREIKVHKEPKYFTLDRRPRKLKSSANRRKPCKLRESITPGTILIILAGKYKGRRVVFLKQLPSGLLLVSGVVNNVHMRRVNQVYVIATSTHVDISKVDLSKVDDKLFTRVTRKVDNKKGDAADKFFKGKQTVTKACPKERYAIAKEVNDQLKPIITAVPKLEGYLKTRFTLTKNMKPHELKF